MTARLVAVMTIGCPSGSSSDFFRAGLKQWFDAPDDLAPSHAHLVSGLFSLWSVGLAVVCWEAGKLAAGSWEEGLCRLIMTTAQDSI